MFLNKIHLVVNYFDNVNPDLVSSLHYYSKHFFSLRKLSFFRAELNRFRADLLNSWSTPDSRGKMENFLSICINFLLLE